MVQLYQFLIQSKDNQWNEIQAGKPSLIRIMLVQVILTEKTHFFHHQCAKQTKEKKVKITS